MMWAIMAVGIVTITVVIIEYLRIGATDDKDTYGIV